MKEWKSNLRVRYIVCTLRFKRGVLVDFPLWAFSSEECRSASWRAGSVVVVWQSCTKVEKCSMMCVFLLTQWRKTEVVDKSTSYQCICAFYGLHHWGSSSSTCICFASDLLFFLHVLLDVYLHFVSKDTVVAQSSVTKAITMLSIWKVFYCVFTDGKQPRLF